jgi:hypothetical protein
MTARRSQARACLTLAATTASGTSATAALAADAGRQFGTEETRIGSLVRDPANGREAQIDRGAREVTSYWVRGRSPNFFSSSRRNLTALL